MTPSQDLALLVQRVARMEDALQQIRAIVVKHPGATWRLIQCKIDALEANDGNA